MAKFHVFHNNKFLELQFVLMDKVALTPEEIQEHFSDIKYVATVDVKDYGDVFRVTNHIDSNWELNPEVLMVKNPGRNRSTSVGDIIIEDSTKRRWVCAPIGWIEIP
jgi:hypothetical protein